jgi:hypothetical protein
MNGSLRVSLRRDEHKRLEWESLETITNGAGNERGRTYPHTQRG